MHHWHRVYSTHSSAVLGDVQISAPCESSLANGATADYQLGILLMLAGVRRFAFHSEVSLIHSSTITHPTLSLIY